MSQLHNDFARLILGRVQEELDNIFQGEIRVVFGGVPAHKSVRWCPGLFVKVFFLQHFVVFEFLLLRISEFQLTNIK